MKKPVRLLALGVVLFCSFALIWYFKSPIPISPEAKGSGVILILETPTLKK